MASSMVDVLKRPSRADYLPRTEPMLGPYGGGGVGNMLPMRGGMIMDRAGRGFADRVATEQYDQDMDEWSANAQKVLEQQQAADAAESERDNAIELIKMGVDIGEDAAAAIGIEPTEYQKFMRLQQAKRMKTLGGGKKAPSGPKYSIENGQVKASSVPEDQIDAVLERLRKSNKSGSITGR